MRYLVGGPWVIGRLRAALLAGVALAALADLTTYAVLVGDEDAAATPSPPGPADVALSLVQAVADDDCGGLDDVLADDAALPPSVTSCLDGVPSPVELSDVRVAGAEVDGRDATVRVEVSADDREVVVVVDLERSGERWRVTGVRPAD
ncbi:MAG: hypothetical protein JWN84_940 [Nocardioides sp.]|nr:hypothetical protein [Nocardioides sp.]